jgi:hypothetical protein
MGSTAARSSYGGVSFSSQQERQRGDSGDHVIASRLAGAVPVTFLAYDWSLNDLGGYDRRADGAACHGVVSSRTASLSRVRNSRVDVQ